jgi:hypothetical protein
MRVAVPSMLRTGTGKGKVRLDEQQWKNDVADAAGQPNSYKQCCKYSSGSRNCYRRLHIHQQIR